jgi:hypothetical protein
MLDDLQWQVVLAAVMGNPRFFEAKKYIEDRCVQSMRRQSIERASRLSAAFAALRGNLHYAVTDVITTSANGPSRPCGVQPKRLGTKEVGMKIADTRLRSAMGDTIAPICEF